MTHADHLFARGGQCETQRDMSRRFIRNCEAGSRGDTKSAYNVHDKSPRQTQGGLSGSVDVAMTWMTTDTGLNEESQVQWCRAMGKLLHQLAFRFLNDFTAPVSVLRSSTFGRIEVIDVVTA
ncbi:hypothetical protein ACLOJK_014031 [Asimina triloba]